MPAIDAGSVLSIEPTWQSGIRTDASMPAADRDSRGLFQVSTAAPHPNLQRYSAAREEQGKLILYAALRCYTPLLEGIQPVAVLP